MSKHMTRAELVALLDEWGWRLEETTEKFQRWIKDDSSPERFVLVPNNQDDPHFERLMQGAQWDLANAESERLWLFMLEIRKLPDSTRRRLARAAEYGSFGNVLAYENGVKSVIDAVNSSLSRLKEGKS